MHVTLLVHTSMVSSGIKIGNSRNHSLETQQNVPSPSQPAKQDAPTTQTTLSRGLPLIRDTLNTRNISKEAKDIIMASWRTGTSKQYQVYIERWSQFCQSKGILFFFFDIFIDIQKGLYNARYLGSYTHTDTHTN